MKVYEKNRNNIISGAAWLGFSAIILKIIGLIYKVPMSYILGDEGMGYFNCAYTVYTFFYIIGSAGIPKAVSILSAKASDGEAKRIFTVVFRLYLLIGVALSLILIVFAPYLSALIGSKKAAVSMLAIAPSVFFICASGVLRGYLNGKMKFAPIAVSELISGLCKLFLGIFFAVCSIKCGYSLPYVCAFSILGITFGSFFGLIYLYVVYKKESKGIKAAFGSKKDIILEVMKLGIPITLASAIGSIVNVIDLAIITNGLEIAGYSETVGIVIYGNYTTLAVPMLGLITSLINPVALAALPIITRCFSERNYKEIEQALDSSLKLSFFWAVPAFFLFLLFSNETLSSIFENSSAILGAPFLCVLAPSVLFYAILTTANTALEGTGRVKWAVTSLIIGAVAKCIVSFVMIGMSEIGALGAPIGTCISYLISMLISLFVIGKEQRIKLNFFKNASIPFVFSILSAFFAIIVKNLWLNLSNIRLNSLLTVMIYGLFYVVFSFFQLIHSKKMLKILSKCTKKKVDDY